MFEQTLSLLAAMWAAIGPGLLLAAALPVLLIALVLITRASVRRTQGT